ncbi:hypothetical protein JHK84_047829 [Glycine max]|nr:hypothetical protein JHK86_047807 [Glycine max]KAG4943777.1 hypothetical protein JHK85_048423 [Glycine max]KAG5102860.1 hypothetical protein JHK84_047829 [Glycine max]
MPLRRKPKKLASKVDSAIRSESETWSNLGASHLHSFASVVDWAIRSSRTVSNLGTSPVPSFASAEDNNAMRVVPARLFTWAELVAATNNFSIHNQIGAGCFSVVYRGKLVDGREVAIKTGGTWPKRESKLTLLSGLHHKNLIRLVGFCETNYERLSVYEYMKNGSLYDRLHDKGSSVLNSWKMRIKIALDASRGIEYLHNYADSFIIHGDIKSSNILLDATWTARVSDFGWKFMRNRRRIIENTDPEYVIRGALSAESDVHGLGVVLFELLTGKRPTFVYGEDGGTLLSRKHLVDFAVTAISNGFLEKILDQRAGQPDVNETEAVKLVADTAIRYVNLKLKDRPTMADIVVRLERALAIFEYDSIFRALVSNC